MRALLSSHSMAPGIAMGLGAVLVLVGGHQIWLGWKNRPLAVPSSSVEIQLPVQTAPSQQPVYRLEYSHAQGVWRFLDGTGAEIAQLPDVLPSSGVWQPPARAMSLDAWGEYVSESSTNGKLNLTASDRRQLSQWQVAGQRPFAELGDGTPLVQPPTTASGMPSSLPVGFDPRSAAFEQHMRDWRRQNQAALKSAPLTREGYVFKAVHPHLGSDAPLVVSSIARNRILSPDFGRKRQDLLIYLQALCNHHMIFLKIDGTTGPKTRQSVTEMAAIVFPDTTSSAEYLRQLQPWLGN